MRKITAGLMILSGIALTIASAWFGINGLLIFFPEKELYNGILFLGVALEIAKVFSAVFLFHYAHDSHIPKLIKTYMGLGVIVLIFISAIATYVHLSYYVADYIRVADKSTSKIEQINKELEVNRTERQAIDAQIAALPSNYISGRVTLMKQFDKRKQQIDEREGVLLKKRDASSEEPTKIDENSKAKEYAFLDYMSASFGKSRQTIYNGLILLLVTVLDPLAIFMTLSGTYIISIKPDPIEIEPEVIETEPEVEPIIIETEIKSLEKLIEAYAKEEEIIPEVEPEVVTPKPRSRINFTKKKKNIVQEPKTIIDEAINTIEEIIEDVFDIEIEPKTHDETPLILKNGSYERDKK